MGHEETTPKKRGRPKKQIAVEPKKNSPILTVRPPSVGEDKPRFPIPLPAGKMQYRGVGVVYGRLTDIDWKNLHGQLHFVLSPDIPPATCFLLPFPVGLLKKLDLSQPYWWIVYPHVYKDVLQFQLSGVKTKLLNPEEIEPDPHFDCRFSIRGSVTLQEADYLLVRVKRNKKRNKPPRPTVIFRPPRLKLLGTVPERVRGWFCDFQAVLTPDGLKIKKMKKIAKLSLPLKKKNKGARVKTKSSP